MTDINIENIVVSTKIAKSLDLDKLADIIPDSKYAPEEAPALIIQFKKPKTAVMLFSNGKVFFTGPKNEEEVDEIIKMIQDRLNAIGINTYKKPDVKIENMVASTDFKKKLDLRLISSKIGNTEYDPKNFPGLIYKTGDPNTIVLLFDSGKIVCNGIKSEEILVAIDKMTFQLTSLGML